MNNIYKLDNLSIAVDTNVLQDFYELDIFNLIFGLFEEVIVPRIVYTQELDEKAKEKLDKKDFTLGIIKTDIGNKTYYLLANNKQYKNLSKADKFLISIAKENNVYCASNDKPVRRTCQELNVCCTGTLGILGRVFFN